MNISLGARKRDSLGPTETATLQQPNAVAGAEVKTRVIGLLRLMRTIGATSASKRLCVLAEQDSR
jgi:hypothetical protein